MFQWAINTASVIGGQLQSMDSKKNLRLPQKTEEPKVPNQPQGSLLAIWGSWPAPGTQFLLLLPRSLPLASWPLHSLTSYFPFVKSSPYCLSWFELLFWYLWTKVYSYTFPSFFAPFCLLVFKGWKVLIRETDYMTLALFLLLELCQKRRKRQGGPCSRHVRNPQILQCPPLVHTRRYPRLPFQLLWVVSRESKRHSHT